MEKIISADQAVKIAKKIREKGQSIVLVGGCFDILHVGHIAFLEKAKKYGESLFVLLESDKSVKDKKGHGRPINSQKERAIILSALHAVDYVVMLPYIAENEKYDKIVAAIKPLYLATTDKDPYVYHKKRQALQIGAKVVFVGKIISDKSTTRLAQIINGLYL